MSQASYEERVFEIKKNLDSVNKRIERSAEKSGRKGQDIHLIAVTKLMSVETIRAGIEAGIRSFGENYPEQAAEKIDSIETDEDVEWHMIGHIQSRKTDTVCKHFTMVHSLDRMKIANYLDRYSKAYQRVMPVLIEVNLTGEKSKYGWEASNMDLWHEILPQFRKITQKPNIEVRGLMTMPPLYDDPESTRPIYQRLRKLQGFLQEKIPDTNWDELSIGTSFDFEVAIEEGATMVRIGTEIFGQRK